MKGFANEGTSTQPHMAKAAYLRQLGINQKSSNTSYRYAAKRMIHAFNTHDFRYLKHAVSESRISHRLLIINMINNVKIYKYFQNIK